MNTIGPKQPSKKPQAKPKVAKKSTRKPTEGQVSHTTTLAQIYQQTRDDQQKDLASRSIRAQQYFYPRHNKAQGTHISCCRQYIDTTYRFNLTKDPTTLTDPANKGVSG